MLLNPAAALNPDAELYTPREIARAAGVSEECVIAAAGSATTLVCHADAVRLGRALRRGMPIATLPLGGISPGLPVQRRFMLATSGTLHAGAVLGIILISLLSRNSTAAAFSPEPDPGPIRLVYLNLPGPGGGGGGGGMHQKTPPAVMRREGTRRISSPAPDREPPATLEEPPKVSPPIDAKTLPTIVAPVASSPADDRDRTGILEEARVETDSRGGGSGGGAGNGTGTGLGSGSGPGIGPGSGGGTGGGPFRPGSGIQPPRLLHEVKPTYPDDARRSGLGGNVEMEIVVQRDGSVGDVKILKGLSKGLNDRATDAVKQWRFAPAQRLGSPVDVIVEVSVEFRLR